MIGDILDKIFGIFKPLEDITYKYYDNDYMIYILFGGVLLFLIAIGYFIFKFIMRLLT